MTKFVTTSRKFFFPKLVRWTPQTSGFSVALGKTFKRFDVEEAKSRIRMINTPAGFKPRYTPSQKYIDLIRSKHSKTTSNTYLLND